MYLFDPEGAGILVLQWDLIGIPVLYELPLLPILAPALLGMVAVHHGIERLAAAVRSAGSRNVAEARVADEALRASGDLPAVHAFQSP